MGKEPAMHKAERTELDHPFLSAVFPRKGQIYTYETIHFKEGCTVSWEISLFILKTFYSTSAHDIPAGSQ